MENGRFADCRDGVRASEGSNPHSRTLVYTHTYYTPSTHPPTVSPSSATPKAPRSRISVQPRLPRVLTLQPPRNPSATLQPPCSSSTLSDPRVPLPPFFSVRQPRAARPTVQQQPVRRHRRRRRRRVAVVRAQKRDPRPWGRSDDHVPSARRLYATTRRRRARQRGTLVILHSAAASRLVDVSGGRRRRTQPCAKACQGTPPPQCSLSDRVGGTCSPLRGSTLQLLDDISRSTSWPHRRRLQR